MILRDLVILVGLGLLGWAIFAFLRLPVPPLLGAIVVIGSLRVAGVSLPEAPGFISLLAQVVLGVYIGAKINKQVLAQMKEIVIPGLIIVAWSLGVAFGLGVLLHYVTYLDLYTAILASSMGGMPEMTVIALATHAQVEVVILMQLFRMIITVIIFPFILKQVVNKGDEIAETEAGSGIDNKTEKKLDFKLIGYWVATFALALAGSLIFETIGVPAGAMVGAMLVVALASARDLPMQKPSAKTFKFMLLGIGVVAANNINQETIQHLMTAEIFQVAIISAVVLFISSIFVSYLIYRITAWDYTTCFLAAAPAGFTVMTMLAVEYNRDPMRVSLLHLSRLIALKAFIPIIFMFLIS